MGDFAEVAVVTAAESVVITARIMELAAVIEHEYRRVAAAKGQVTKARKTGHPGKIAAAEYGWRMRMAEADKACDAAVEEMLMLNRRALGNMDDLLAAWDH